MTSEYKRTRKFNIAFFPDEFEEIKKYAKLSKKTTSEFIRVSIEDKIRRIKNPVENGVKKQLHNGEIRQDKQLQEQKKSLKKDANNYLKEVKELSNQVKELMSVDEYEIITVENVIKDLGQASLVEIKRKVVGKFDPHKVKMIIRRSKKIGVNMDGKYELRGSK